MSLHRSTESLTLASQLASYVHTSRWDDFPEKVRHETLRAFVNWVGCAVGGARTASADTTLQALLAMSGPGDVPVLGRTERLSAGDAALANCLMSAADTFDDTHLSTITHPTGPIAATIMAVAASRRISGQAMLHALAIGMEIECRISACITDPASGAHQGWYITGVSGNIGAAAAAALLLGATPQQTAIAMCLAATQSAGLRASHGGMSVAFIPGIAARNGLASAHMAIAGFTSGDHVIEGRNGLLPVLAPKANPAIIVDRLGEHFELLGNACKPYPCGIVIHPSIDACLDIARQLDDASRIRKVELAVHADALFLCWRKLPATPLEAQVSLYHWTAAALLRGQAGLEEGTTAAVADPAIRRLQEHMDAQEDATLGPGQARATVYLDDGSTLHSNIKHTTGSLENPLSDDDLSEKFRLLARQRLDEENAGQLLQACWSIHDSNDVGEIGRMAALSSDTKT